MYFPNHATGTFGGDPFRITRSIPALCLRMSVVVGNYLDHPSSRVSFGKKQAPVLIILILAGFLYLTGTLNTSLVFAQAAVASATLKGLITDQAGAGIRQATITVTSVDRGTVRSASTDLPPTAPLGFVSAAPARQFRFGLQFEL
jgi:hypothetical protein